MQNIFISDDKIPHPDVTLVDGNSAIIRFHTPQFYKGLPGSVYLRYTNDIK